MSNNNFSFTDHTITGTENPYTGSVIHRHLKISIPTVVKTEGPYLIDANGKKYFDASGGAAVSCLGHSDAEIIYAVKSQLDEVSYAHTSFFTSSPLEELSNFLTSRAPDPLNYCYVVSSGSESVEASLKLARQHFVEIGQPNKKKFIARKQSYHGNTLGALGVGGNAWRKAQFEPILIPGTLIEPCYEYRFKKEGESVEEYGIRSANQLEDAILQSGEENVAAFIAETVGGATSGCLTPVTGYFKRLREICDKYNVLLILDEVMCGSGRTGSLFAFEQEGIVPDIVTMAKSLGAGYQPIAAALVSEKIVSSIKNGSGFFQHGHTYLGHTTACACALAVQKKIERENLLKNVQEQGEYLFNSLLENNIPHVGNIRGRGLFVGLELVQDIDEKKPFDPKHKLNKRIKAKGMENGLMCYPMGGTVDGKIGDHVMVAPPFNSTKEHIDEVVQKLTKTITESCEDIS